MHHLLKLIYQFNVNLLFLNRGRLDRTAGSLRIYFGISPEIHRTEINMQGRDTLSGTVLAYQEEIVFIWALYTLPEGGRVGYTKKTLQELDLIDNFLSNAVASNREISEPFYRQLLSVLLGKELGKIHVQAQQFIPGGTPELRGIRMDVEITEYNEGMVTGVYDLEPHMKDGLDLPKHNRYYQAKIDGRYVKRGLKDFSAIPSLYVITITDYDIFGRDYMMYTVCNGCEEVPELEYDDGLKFIYFYTKGTRGGSQEIKNVLTYFQNSDSRNAVDEATRVIDSYVKRVKSLPEVEAGYMTFGDWIDSIKEDLREDLIKEMTEEVTAQVTAEVTEQVTAKVTEQVTAEVTEQVTAEVTEQVTAEVTERNIKTVIEMFQEDCVTKADAVSRIQAKFPECAEWVEKLIERYWQEN